MLGTAEPSICAQQALGCKLLTLGFFFAACATQADIAASRSSERCCIVRARAVLYSAPPDLAPLIVAVMPTLVRIGSSQMFFMYSSCVRSCSAHAR